MDIINVVVVVVVFVVHNNIKNKQALNVTLLLAKYHICATSSCDGKLSFENFLLRLLEILKQSYTAANKSCHFFFYIRQSVVIHCFAPFLTILRHLTKIDIFGLFCFAFVIVVVVFFPNFFPHVRFAP